MEQRGPELHFRFRCYRTPEFECSRCDRKGCYALRRLIAKYGNVSIKHVLDELPKGCPKHEAQMVYRCSVGCPTLRDLVLGSAD